MFKNYTIEEIRSISKKEIEELEFWLRKILNERLINHLWVDYLNSKELPISTCQNILVKFNSSDRKWRYEIWLDASELNDLKSIINHNSIYKDYLKDVFNNTFENKSILVYFLWKLIEPRNKLYHSNPISLREAEQIFCYSHDIIESIRNYYDVKNDMDYKVPRIIKFEDSLWNKKTFSWNNEWWCSIDLKHCKLKPGDNLKVSISLTEEEKITEIKWGTDSKNIITTPISKNIDIEICENDIWETFQLYWIIKSKNNRMKSAGWCADIILVTYKVVPK